MNKETTYYFENGTRTYIMYDAERQTAQIHGRERKVTIQQDKLIDFLHTAEILGFKIGKL